MASLYTPATNIAAIKQELLQPPPSLPPPTPILPPSLSPPTHIPPSPEPILQPITFAAIKQELQPLPSLPLPTHIRPPSLTLPTHIPPSPEPILQSISFATLVAAIKQELLQPSPSLPTPTPILPTSLAPPTHIPSPLPPSTPILPPSLPSLTPILVPPPLAVVKTEPEQDVREQEQPQQQLQFLKSINDLASLSKALNSFNSKFEELTNHIVSINQAIHSKLNEPPPVQTNIASSTTPPQQQQQIQTQQPESLKQTETETPKTDPCPIPPRCSIQRHCQRMNAKCVRKYIVSNLSDVPKLREEIPEALKLAPEPAKLVLDCVGQLFLVGKKACTNNPYTITARQALVLLLDIFGTFHGQNRIIVVVKVKVEAEKVAIGWRKRLIKEGGMDKASQIDARALLLFVAYFGIPRVFSNVDLGNLFNLSNPKGISNALKASPLLPCKIPDIIDTMAKTGMHYKAVEVATIFGLEDKFSPSTILTSLLPESTKAFERAQQKACITPLALKKATRNHLVALRLTVRCLENRGSDGTLLLGSWQIKEKIVKLEEEMVELDKRIAEKKVKRLKRKLDQMESSSTVKSQETKHLRFETEGPPLPKSHVNQLCEQSTAVLAECDGLVPNSLNANNYPAVSAAPHGSSNGIGHMAGTTGVGSSSMGVIPSSSCSVEGGEIEVDKTGQMMSGNGLPYKWQPGCVPQSASMWFASLFGSSPSVEGFVGVLDSTVRTSADRYRFADSVA